MTLTTTITTRGFRLREVDDRRIRHQVGSLRRRLVHQAAPQAILALEWRESERRVTANLRVQLGPLGTLLISTRDGESAAHAARLAIADVERQLERRLAHERGEASFGVPSRRLPEALRPRTVARLFRDARPLADADP